MVVVEILHIVACFIELANLKIYTIKYIKVLVPAAKDPSVY